ncbi:hypothetical protein ACJX0J_027509, partial [Zea mays]
MHTFFDLFLENNMHILMYILSNLLPFSNTYYIFFCCLDLFYEYSHNQIQYFSLIIFEFTYVWSQFVDQQTDTIGFSLLFEFTYVWSHNNVEQHNILMVHIYIYIYLFSFVSEFFYAL